MKHPFQSVVFFTTVTLGAIACLTGCVATGMDRAATTTNMMEKVEGDYRQASVQVDATRVSLEDLISPGQSDLKKAYNVYATEVARMEDLGKRLDLHTEKMQARNNEYFAEWESSYANPEIREVSERRCIEMRALYAKIPEASVGVKGTLKSYLSDIKEIQMYLANDLTPQSIQAISPIAHRSVQDGDHLKDDIKPVLTAIDRVKVEMAQGGAK